MHPGRDIEVDLQKKKEGDIIRVIDSDFEPLLNIYLLETVDTQKMYVRDIEVDCVLV